MRGDQCRPPNHLSGKSLLGQDVLLFVPDSHREGQSHSATANQKKVLRLIPETEQDVTFWNPGVRSQAEDF